MTRFASFADLLSACLDLPGGHAEAAADVASREGRLTKPPRSLGRLEEAVAWLSLWQGKSPPRLATVEILVFAGNHGVTAQGVSAYPAEVTAQMVANFATGGAAINQLAQVAGAELRVVALDIDHPTADFTLSPAMDEAEFLEAVAAGYEALSPEADLVVLGEMGIGNTTAASAISAALFGGGGARFAGHGTGIDERGLKRKQDVIDAFNLYGYGGLVTATGSGWTDRSDHAPFDEAGYDAVLIIESSWESNPHYHKSTDAVESNYLDYTFATNVTRATVGYLADFAGVASTTSLLTVGIDGDLLTLDYAGDQNGTVEITIRATDQSGLWVEDTFVVTIQAAPVAADDAYTVESDTVLSVL
ncbi:MAG: nicotinate-nucleotide--dimethylbenzimidazole phosphoribosyltransferase, partial [Methyloceanibacter sp.]|nr:nicotinate-nucleotide--dimethylbenzimidazole phosphoribosyltransferase [Methyloceanibacter sp.]